MKRIILAAIAGASLLGLTACNDAAEDGDTLIVDEAAPSPAETTTVVIDPGDASDTVSIDKDGVSATVNDGDTSVTATTGKNPSATVTTD